MPLGFIDTCNKVVGLAYGMYDLVCDGRMTGKMMDFNFTKMK